MTITEQIQHMGTVQFWVFLAFLTVIAVACFYGGFSLLRRARLIEDTPTARIRSAAQGYVELNGTVHPDPKNPLIAPLTDTKCCWYRYEIERKSDKNWRTVEQGTSEYPFLIEDDTGRCIILPKGAEVTPSDQSVWYGSSRQPDDRNPPRKRIRASVGGMRVKVDGGGFNRKITFGSLFTSYRYTEERIYAGDMLYALGHFRTLDDHDHQQSRSQLTSEILRMWKQDQSRMVDRFDVDGDGKIDPDEWDNARRSAQRIAGEKYAEQRKEQVIHTLAKSPVKGYPYLLSTLEAFELAKRYRTWFMVLMVVFFLAGGGAFLLISGRL